MSHARGSGTRYTSVTDDDRRDMLEAVGASGILDLFEDIPAELLLDAPPEIEGGLSEHEVYERIRALAERNVSAEDEMSFLGAGMYDHYVPAIVDAIIGRSEFLTPYTPYQPEVSQGGLQVMFEYQTAITELTGLPVSNASLYDGPSAVAAAGYLARLVNGRPEVVSSRGVHPHSRATLVTQSHGYGSSVIEVPLVDGVTDPEAFATAVGPSTSAVVVQQPNFLGAIEDLEPLISAAREHDALVIVSCDPLALALLRTPGELGADVAVGEGQALGNRLDYGGPSFGFIASRQEHIRRMPGRIAGETVDRDGRRGWVLTLQTREQHIRREKATSNICTAQVLNALAGMVYLAWLGRRGIVDLAELIVRRADYARQTLAAVDGVRTIHEQPIFREFAIGLDVPVGPVVDRLARRGVNPGYRLGRDYPEFGEALLVAITERRSKQDIDRLAAELGAAIAAEVAA
ncbi:MAG: aminomethyl-transferring glycine dehydrogenase subunit GcvPA [Thermoleophilia bacterium]|nr:aminomethyl-transferring glycine dehydrogenase subunit GcvPA [Thermoleophilia bacterium]